MNFIFETAPSKAKPLNPTLLNNFKPKPILVWQPKSQELTSSSFPIRETQQFLPGQSSSLSSVSAIHVIDNLSSDVVDAVPIMLLTKLNKVSNVAAAEILGSNEANKVRNELSALTKSINVSDVVIAAILSSDEADKARNESACTSDGEESLQRDLRLIL